MTESMIEKCARAMAERREELITQPLARIYPELVRAVLVTLRDNPTSDMLEDGYACLLDVREPQGQSMLDWEAMIRRRYAALFKSILKESGEGK